MPRYTYLSAPSGPFVQGTQFIYDDNIVQNGLTGMYRPLAASDLGGPGGGISIGDGANLDAFSRLRTSEGLSLFDSSFKYDLRPLLFYQVSGNGGSISHDPQKVSAVLSVGTLSGSSAILQSKQYHRYLPGKSQFIVTSQVPGAPVANVVKRFGYFDASNGIFFEQNGTTDIAFVIRSGVSGSIVDRRVVQSGWNLDKLDGTGPSRIRLDLSKAQIFIADLQWLAMGRVRVGFDINGQIVYCHEFLNANNLDVPYMQTAHLPIRWEVNNSAASAGGSMLATCAAVQSEGGLEKDEGFTFSVSTPATIATNDTTRTILLAIRPTTGYYGKVNRVLIQPQNSSVLAGNNPVIVEAWYNPTFNGGGAWQQANQFSAVEWGTGQSYSDLGTKISTYFVGSSNANQGDAVNAMPSRRFPLVVDVSGYNPIALAITAKSNFSNSACHAEIEWAELP
jgi:hypothetical protein